MALLTRVSAVLTAGTLAASGVARAEQGIAATEPAGDRSEDSAAQQVEFRADRLEFSPSSDELLLEGNVDVQVDRYRLTSDRLELSRGPRGIIVDGRGRVAFCPCPNPPLTVGFRSALVAPPTDLILKQPVVRVGPVPIFWLPYLWLRSKTRIGMLPLIVGYRGPDGFVAGTGMHVPFGRDDGAPMLDISAAGYVKGGVDGRLKLTTSRSATTIRWDHLHRDLLSIQARGAETAPSGGVVAWNVDAWRGERVLGGPLLLEQAAARFDRGIVSAGRSTSSVTSGLAVRADAVRAGPLDRVDAVGPSPFAGVALPMGEIGTFDASVVAQSIGGASGDETNISHNGAVAFEARPGPLSLSAVAHSRFDASLLTDAVHTGEAGGFEGRLGLPLSRTFGDGPDPLQHWVTPDIEAGGGWAHAQQGLVAPWLHPDGAFIHSSGGITTTLGRYGSRRAATLELRGGTVGTPDRLASAASTRLVGRSDTFAFSVDGGLVDLSHPSLSVLSTARVGRLDSWHVGARAQGRRGRAAARARLLDRGGWQVVRAPWLARDGWTWGAFAGASWSDWLATALDADFDQSRKELLGVRGSIAYRHPCGCVALTAWAGHRLGRRGADTWLTVDLFP